MNADITRTQANFAEALLTDVTECHDITPQRRDNAQLFINSIVANLVEYVTESTHQDGAETFDSDGKTIDFARYLIYSGDGTEEAMFIELANYFFGGEDGHGQKIFDRLKREREDYLQQKQG